MSDPGHEEHIERTVGRAMGRWLFWWWIRGFWPYAVTVGMFLFSAVSMGFGRFPDWFSIGFMLFQFVVAVLIYQKAKRFMDTALKELEGMSKLSSGDAKQIVRDNLVADGQRPALRGNHLVMLYIIPVHVMAGVALTSRLPAPVAVTIAGLLIAWTLVQPRNDRGLRVFDMLHQPRGPEGLPTPEQ